MNAVAGRAGQSAPLLEVSGVRKAYPGIRALGGVDLTVERGEFHALLGANGAGKSTLAKIIAGAEPADDGSIRFAGDEILGLRPGEITRRGLAVIHQQLALFPPLTVAENLALLLGYPRRGLLIARGEMRRRAQRALDLLGDHAIDPQRRLEDLRLAETYLVAIAAALAGEPRLLIMDESTASLPEPDARIVFEALRERTADGLSVLLVSHRMQEIRDIGDRITVLKDGSIAGTVPAATPTRELVLMMFGAGVADIQTPREHDRAAVTGEPLLTVEGLRTSRLRGLDLSVHRGEIVGLAGALGAGRSELARVLAGLRPIESGTVLLHGEPFRPRSPAEAMRRGVALVPEDRDADGVLPGLSVATNVTVAVTNTLRRGRTPLLDRAREGRVVDEMIDLVGIRAARDQEIGTLSGGNRQKTLIARALLIGADLLILDEPTKGIDIGSRLELHATLRRLAGEGKGIIVISSELDDLVRDATRIVVLRDGVSVSDDAPFDERALAELSFRSAVA